jgi:predicted hydrolase (HD superfamily)
MTRDEALALVQAKVAADNLVKHMLATEAVMGALAAAWARTRNGGPWPVCSTTWTWRRPRR